MTNNDTAKMVVTFWGVRGSIPVSGDNTAEYGGNTSCVQLMLGTTELIIDAGTGAYNLGQHFGSKRRHTRFLLSHLHWDHLQGLPFFAPIYTRGSRIQIWGPHSQLDKPLHTALAPPWFPISLEHMAAEVDYVQLESNQTREVANKVFVKTFSATHPGGCLAFRIEHLGKACCYVSDHECGTELNPALINFLHEADLLVHDAQYTDEEYHGGEGNKPRYGWGHSTWQQAVTVAKESGVKQLLFFHHDPSRNDQELRKIEQTAQRDFPYCAAAKEGMRIEL